MRSPYIIYTDASPFVNIKCEMDRIEYVSDSFDRDFMQQSNIMKQQFDALIDTFEKIQGPIKKSERLLKINEII
jgi:hypothetical protein